VYPAILMAQIRSLFSTVKGLVIVSNTSVCFSMVLQMDRTHCDWFI